MIEQVITDQAGETLIIKWDGTRFALLHQKRTREGMPLNCILLSPKEMLEVIIFGGSCGKSVL